MNKKETSNCRKHVLNELKVAFSLIKENYKYIKYAENEREDRGVRIRRSGGI